MSEAPKNIYPVFDKILGRYDKEKLLNQNGKVVWLTGLSGAGKTTVAKCLEEELFQRGYLTQILDGDNIRSGINNNLGFSDEDRYENIRRISEVSRLFVNCGVITINCFISPTEEIRNMAKVIIGAQDFIEVYINAPIEVCEQRDTKGLYARARLGEIENFTGITSSFEKPENFDIEVRTDIYSAKECAKQILEIVLPRVEYGST